MIGLGSIAGNSNLIDFSQSIRLNKLGAGSSLKYTSALFSP
jgi:hypothetical protein